MSIISKNICIIPARGGSKRIPRKNVKNFLGKPIIAYSIEAAINSAIFDEVMVSTDDEEIAKVAEEYGAKVPFLRSVENADDFATTLDVLKEVLDKYKQEGYMFNVVGCIYPCAPFVTSVKLQNAYHILSNNNFDLVMPVIKFSFPIQRALTFNENRIVFAYPEFANSRSQDLNNHYHDAGQFYLMKIEETILKNRMVSKNSGAIIISELEGQDIDNEMDWKLAELKYQI